MIDLSAPMLTGNGFRLRHWHIEDAHSLQRHADDERVSLGLSDRFPWPYSFEDATAFLNASISAPDNVRAIDIEGRAVGGIGVRAGEGEQRICAEIGYWLGRDYWGRGLMTRIVASWCDHLFATRPLQRLQANVFAANPASARVLEKCGFAFEGTRRQAVIKRGRILDVRMYAKLRGQGAS
ncbi:MAG: GNAT family protein [Dokdonella sp.]